MGRAISRRDFLNGVGVVAAGTLVPACVTPSAPVFDDSPRWSTTIPEQRRKARHIVQCFAQIRDFLLTGRKPALKSLSRDPVLALFDRVFSERKRRLLLKKIGFREETREALMQREPALIQDFEKPYRHFEHARSSRGPRKVPDGINWNAVFCTRDLLRELPARYARAFRRIPAEEFLDIACSSYATRADRALTPHRRRMASAFQRCYLRLIEAAARHTGTGVDALLADLAERSALINRAERVTGDSLTHAAASLVRNRQTLSAEALGKLLKEFVRRQDLVPPQDRRGERTPSASSPPGAKAGRSKPSCGEEPFLDDMLQLVKEYRHSL